MNFDIIAIPGTRITKNINNISNITLGVTMPFNSPLLNPKQEEF